MNIKAVSALSRVFSLWVVLALVLTFGMTSSVFAAPGDLTRVSVSSIGTQADAISYSGKISANGRFVVFDSEAGNLVPGDTNGLADVFLHDRQLGTTTRVSVDASGAQVNGGGDPDVSADGRFVVFDSGATNLVTGDTNDFSDLFVKDTQTGAVTRVSVDSGGAQANNDSTSPSISGDGRYVTFLSEASNLVPNDVNGVADVFVHDLQTGLTVCASPNANAPSFDLSISLDGHFVVFSSGATNLVSNDTNVRTDVFVYAVQTGLITRASVNSSGVQADKGATDPSISGDGRYVTFSSYSENLLSQDTLGFEYVYVHDFVTGSTNIVSVNNGYPMIGWSDSSEISADGRYIAFSYDDKGDGEAVRWIHIFDRVANINLTATQGGDTHAPILPSLSSDGRFLVFASSGPWVDGDTNGVRDIFVKEVKYPPELNPTVKSVGQGCSTGCSGHADQIVDFGVKFSEPVTGVDVSDFVLTVGGGISGAVITGVSGAGSDYDVVVNTGTGDGTLRLDVVDDDSIKDFPLNPLGGVGTGNGIFTAGEVILVDKSIPVVTSITRLDASPSTQSSVRFSVVFSESVSYVSTYDFSIVTTGAIAGASVTEVLGSGNAYTVTVNSGSGDGTLRLDLIDTDSIVDAASSLLGGPGEGNGNFTSGEVYVFERNMPIVNSITRMDANPSNMQSVRYRVTFSESVTGVDISDFVLTPSGISDASILTVEGSGDTHTVTVGTGTGSGTLRLDLMDNDSIVDSSAVPLGGAGVGNGNFPGETYAVDKSAAVVQSVTFRSTGANDGWVLESSENSNVGGSVNSVAATFNLGDSAQDAQYRAILHFPTYYLPDNAVVTQVILVIKKQSVTGTDPFTTHQNIQLDICSGLFGFDGTFGSFSLLSSDFQAPAGMNAAGTIQNNPVNDRYWSLLNASANSLINRVGITQIRLSFQGDDNDDLGDDYISFFSGDAVHQLDRPHLLVEYYTTR